MNASPEISDAAVEVGVDPDAERFRGLYDAHFDAVSRYAQSRASNDMAKDATAQTFLVAWRRRQELFATRSPLGWLLGVTRRTLADERRAAARQTQLATRLGASVAPLPADPGDVVADSDAVATAFSRLREADREILAMVTWDDLSPDDAAAVLGCSRATFAVRLHRARTRLRLQLRLATTDGPTGATTTRTMTSHPAREGNNL